MAAHRLPRAKVKLEVFEESKTSESTTQSHQGGVREAGGDEQTQLPNVGSQQKPAATISPSDVIIEFDPPRSAEVRDGAPVNPSKQFKVIM